MDEIDREGGWEEKNIQGRAGEISFASYSIKAAQLGGQRHTSKKGKHAEALEFREGEEDITSPNLQIKVRICTLSRFSFKLSTAAAPQNPDYLFFSLKVRVRESEKWDRHRCTTTPTSPVQSSTPWSLQFFSRYYDLWGLIECLISHSNDFCRLSFIVSSELKRQIYDLDKQAEW